MTKRTQVKKAWAIVDSKNRIENADYFAANECCNSDETQAMAVYETKDEADTMNSHPETYSVIPVTISYKIKKKV